MPDFPFNQHGIILFDGLCNYCSRWVDRIIKNDKKDYFRFASLQSENAKIILKQLNAHSQNSSVTLSVQPDTFILIENGKIFFRSEAALRILRRLQFPFYLLFVCILIPGFIRDGVYNLIAKNRYKWFGKREICRMAVTEEEKRKFLN